MLTEQKERKLTSDLGPQDLEVCGISLGMSRQQIKQLKYTGPKPTFIKEGAALSYVYGGLVGQKVEAYETDRNRKACRMTGWILRCPKLNIELQEGQDFEDGATLKRAFGSPDRILCYKTYSTWHYAKLQLTVVAEKQRFGSFVVGKEDER